MKHFLVSQMRPVLKGLAVATLMITIVLISQGRVYLLGGLLLGYLAAAVCSWNLVYRTWKSMELDVAGAKRQMLWGFGLRLMTIFIVFFAAVQISPQVFGVVVLGFFTFYMLGLFHLALYNYREAKKNK